MFFSKRFLGPFVLMWSSGGVVFAPQELPGRIRQLRHSGDIGSGSLHRQEGELVPCEKGANCPPQTSTPQSDMVETRI